jgi:NADP-dependent 3-hydroxy acid dehydrogenase YdfG
MPSVFITGAAAGIGLATARRFANRGWTVGLYDINLDALSQAASDGGLPDAHTGFCDVADRDSVSAAMADFAGKSGGAIDVVVNNAGVLTAGSFKDIEAAQHERMIDINVKGFTHVAQLAFPYLCKSTDGCLVNLCSASSIHGVPRLAVYSATKFYVNAITQALHIEWAPHGIHVTCVKPHLVDTPMAHDVTAQGTGSRDINLKPEDIAGAIEKAVSGRRISYVVGAPARVWAVLDKLLPEYLRMVLTRRLIGKAGE